MDFLITELPNSAIGWIGLLIGAVAIGFMAYLAYNRNRDGADDRLIKILQTTVEEMEKKVDSQGEEIEELTLKVAALTTTNETLTRILQGRDENTQRFQAEVLAAVKIGGDTNEIAKRNEVSLGKLTDLISAHIVAMETSGKKG